MKKDIIFNSDAMREAPEKWQKRLPAGVACETWLSIKEDGSGEIWGEVFDDKYDFDPELRETLSPAEVKELTSLYKKWNRTAIQKEEAKIKAYKDKKAAYEAWLKTLPEEYLGCRLELEVGTPAYYQGYNPVVFLTEGMTGQSIEEVFDYDEVPD